MGMAFRLEPQQLQVRLCRVCGARDVGAEQHVKPLGTADEQSRTRLAMLRNGTCPVCLGGYHDWRYKSATVARRLRKYYGIAEVPDVRVLSVLLPWALWLVDGSKPIENRRWSTRWRGRMLVRATERPTARDRRLEVNTAIGARDYAEGRARGTTEAVLEQCRGKAGQILGWVDVVDILPPTPAAAEVIARRQLHDRELRWWFREQYGWLLARPTALVGDGIPCPGGLGLRRAPSELVKRLEAYGGWSP